MRRLAMNRFRARDLLLYLLRGYKWAISPMFLPACRYVPTCSENAMEAVERRGVMRGIAMATWRVLRCHPFAKGGYDPVVMEQNSNAACLLAEVSNHCVSQLCLNSPILSRTPEWSGVCCSCSLSHFWLSSCFSRS